MRESKDYELDHLPDKERQGFLPILLVWGGFTFAPASLLFGGILGASATLWEIILVTLLGCGMAAVVGIGVGIFSREEGLSFHTSSRYFYGIAGSWVPAGLMFITRIGWTGVTISTAAGMIHAAIGSSSLLFIAVTIILGVVYTSTAFLGFHGLKWVSYIGVPLVTAVFIFGAFNIAATTGAGFFGALPNEPSEPMLLTALIGMCAAYWFSGSTTSGDWLRYGKSNKAIAGATLIAVVLFSMFFFILGAFSSAATGNSDIALAMASTGLAAPAAISMFLIGWTTSDNQLYTAGLAGSNMVGVSKRKVVVATGIVSTLLAATGFYQQIIPFLSFIGILVPPLGAVFITDYFLLGYRKVKRPHLHEIKNQVNPAAIIAWAVASTIAYFTPAMFIVPAVAYVVATLVYLACYAITKHTNLKLRRIAGVNSC